MRLEDAAAERHFDRQLALVREHWTAARHFWLDDPDIPAARKLRADLPGEFWIGCGMPGLARIGPTRDGRFEFTEYGRTAVIIPVYDTIPGLLVANAARHVEHLVDLVAVDLDHPGRLYRRRGEALVLGAAYLEIARQDGEPVPVFKNSMNWLKSGGDGIVVLDWDWARDLLLGLDLAAEDVELGERLDAALKPNIWIRRAAA